MATITCSARAPAPAAAAPRQAANAARRVAVSRPAIARTFAPVSHPRATRQMMITRSASTESTGVNSTALKSYKDIIEVDKNTWEKMLNMQPVDKVVVLDCFTDWCGPCKLIYPELCEMAATTQKDVQFYKLNCNQFNKELGKALGVRVAPTFFLFKGGVKVAEMTGAKVDQLTELIENNK